MKDLNTPAGRVVVRSGRATERDAERLANIIGRMNALEKETHDRALRERLRVALKELTPSDQPKREAG